MDKPLVSVIIPTHNRKEKLIRLINSILESNYPKDRLEIIVVDDASTDGTYNAVKMKFQQVKIIRNERELLPTASRNIGIKNSHGGYLFFIDDDNVVKNDTITHLIDAMESNRKLGLCGPVTVYYSDPFRIWCAGAFLKKPLYYMVHYKVNSALSELKEKLIYCDYIPNAYATRKEIIDKIGYFDEKNFPIAWEEIDFAQRVKKAGYDVAVVTLSIVMHDVPKKPYVGSLHIKPKRSYYRGRSRVMFYKKYVSWRLLGLFIDMIGFSYLALKYSNQGTKNINYYVKGVLNGLLRKSPAI
ncbi:MAG: glycosyltransferase family 2 protein [Nitrososphaerota archaeon]